MSPAAASLPRLFFASGVRVTVQRDESRAGKTKFIKVCSKEGRGQLREDVAAFFPGLGLTPGLGLVSLKCEGR